MIKTLNCLLAAALTLAAAPAAAKESLGYKRGQRAYMKATKQKPAPLTMKLKDGKTLASKAVVPLTQRNAGWGLDGSWYNPTFDGQGWFVQYLNKRERVWAAFFTYDDAGNKEWYVGEGPLEGDTAHLTVHRPEGGRHMVPTIETPYYPVPAGEAWITLDYCDQAYFEWDLSLDPLAPAIAMDWMETVKLTDPRTVVLGGAEFDLCEDGPEDPEAAKRARK